MLPERILLVVGSVKLKDRVNTALKAVGLVGLNIQVSADWSTTKSQLRNDIFETVIIDSAVAEENEVLRLSSKVPETKVVYWTPLNSADTTTAETSYSENSVVPRKLGTTEFSEERRETRENTRKHRESVSSASDGGRISVIRGTDSELGQAVIKQLQKINSGGQLSAVSLSSFLQILALDQKTCTLRLNKSGTFCRGVLFLAAGEIVDAKYQNYRGDIAADAICAWGDVDLRLEKHSTSPARRISRSIHQILLEAATAVDESSALTDLDFSVEEIQQASADPAAVTSSSNDDQLSRESAITEALRQKLNLPTDAVEMMSAQQLEASRRLRLLLEDIGEPHALYAVCTHLQKTQIMLLVQQCAKIALHVPSKFSRHQVNEIFRQNE